MLSLHVNTNSPTPKGYVKLDPDTKQVFVTINDNKAVTVNYGFLRDQLSETEVLKIKVILRSEWELQGCE